MPGASLGLAVQCGRGLDQIAGTGAGIDGVKHPLTRVQRSAENTTLVRCLLVGFRERGLHVRDYPPEKMRRVPRRMRKVQHANCTLVTGAHCCGH